eukprot:1442428-Rhodomonas_salina.1
MRYVSTRQRRIARVDCYLPRLLAARPYGFQAPAARTGEGQRVHAPTSGTNIRTELVPLYLQLSTCVGISIRVADSPGGAVYGYQGRIHEVSVWYTLRQYRTSCSRAIGPYRQLGTWVRS